MSNVSLNLTNAIKQAVINVAGPEYKEMAYYNELTRNTFRNITTQFAVQAGSVTEISGVTKYITFSQNFTVVLSKGYLKGEGSDELAVQASFDLRQIMFDLYKSLINTKAGFPSRVMNVTELNMDSPEYLSDEKVTVLRGNFNVIYRLNLLGV